jgi:hypothetical protein
LAEDDLVAGSAYHLVDAAVDDFKLLQTIACCIDVNGC